MTHFAFVIFVALQPVQEPAFVRCVDAELAWHMADMAGRDSDAAWEDAIAACNAEAERD